jgi:predicted nucleic acid-binding Zn ribbon protein
MKRTCIECGTVFEPSRHDAEFCNSRCRQAFANRRQQRGAELYDLFMVHRFERAAGQDIKALSLMNRLASQWRTEDNQARAGRKSWTALRKLRWRLTHIMATVVHRARP